MHALSQHDSDKQAAKVKKLIHNRAKKSRIDYYWIFNWKKKNAGVVLGIFYLSALALSYFALLLPRSTYVHAWLNDVFALLNGAYRVSQGQVPSVDFHAAYGPFVFYIPGLGLRAGLAPSAIFAFDSVIVAAFILLAAVLTMYRRFSLPASLTTLIFLWLLIVVPVPSGVRDITWGTFYNRHGWAALAVLMLFYVEPENRNQYDKWLDSAIVALLTVFLLYMKATFGVAGLVFIIANGLTSKYNRQICYISIAIIISLAALAEFLFGSGYNRRYFEDIFSVPKGTLIGFFGLRALVNKLIADAWVFLACAGALLATLAAGRRPYFFDWAYVFGAIGGSVVLLELTGGATQGLPVLIAVFVCCGELARRTESKRDASGWRNHSGSLACLFLALMFISDPVATRIVGWSEYYYWTHVLRPLPGLPAALSGFLVREELWTTQDISSDDEEARRFLPFLARFRLVGDRNLAAHEYLLTVIDGAKLLSTVTSREKTLFVLDNADPFTVAFNMKPTKNGYPFLWTAGLTAERHPQPQQMFNGVDFIMLPLLPYDPVSSGILLNIYGEYIDREFVEIKRSRYWRLLAHNSNRNSSGVRNP